MPIFLLLFYIGRFYSKLFSRVCRTSRIMYCVPSPSVLYVLHVPYVRMRKLLMVRTTNQQLNGLVPDR